MEVYAPLGSPATRGKKQDSDPVPLEDPVIKEIASKYNATVGQVLAPITMVTCVTMISCPPDLHSFPASPRTGGVPQVCDPRQDQGKPESH